MRCIHPLTRSDYSRYVREKNFKEYMFGCMYIRDISISGTNSILYLRSINVMWEDGSSGSMYDPEEDNNV